MLGDENGLCKRDFLVSTHCASECAWVIYRVRLAVFLCTHALNKGAWGVSKIHRKSLAGDGENPLDNEIVNASRLHNFLLSFCILCFLPLCYHDLHLRLDDSGVCVQCLWFVTNLQVNRYVFNYVILHRKPIRESKAPPELRAEVLYPRNTSAEP